MYGLKQRYVSKELTHFVGAKFKNDEAKQYETLLEILKSGLLIHSKDSVLQTGLLISSDKKISDNDMYTPFCVCFCDIPVDDLDIHVKKYSRFGLSFDKDFIIKQGGKPLYYVPKLGRNFHIGSGKSNSQYFNDMTKHYHNVIKILLSEIAERHHSYAHRLPPLRPRGSKAPKTIDAVLKHYPAVIIEIKNFLDFNLFSYIKFFDHNLNDTHRKNYYFEREWRIIGNVKFELKDVKRILIPRDYAKPFRYACPNYYGQISFID